MLRSEIPLDPVILVLAVSWEKWLLVGMYKAEITKEQSWIWAIGWEVHRGLWTQVTWTKPVQHVSVFPLLSFCPWSFILMKIVIKQLVISLVHDVQILTSPYVCCLSFSVGSSSSWLSKLQMSCIPIGRKAWTEGAMPGSGHSYHRDDGLKGFGGGLCHFA